MSNDYNNKRYYWIKLKDTFFTSDTVDFLMSQKDGANYVVLYQMLCLKTANTNGELSRQIGEIIIPFDIEKIQRDCKYFTIDTIRVALELYKKLGLIYEQENGILQISNFDNLVGSETQGAVVDVSIKRSLKMVVKHRKVSAEMIMLPQGKLQFVDEKRYGGNGAKAFERANYKCEICGSPNKLVIHHNNGYSCDLDDLVILCSACHGKAHTRKNNGHIEIKRR